MINPMAKSSLFHHLRRALQAARHPNAELRPASVIETPVSRRRILQAGVGLAAGALLGTGCQTSETAAAGPYTTEERSIVVIGGGIAGLHCAYRLRQAGIIATVFEASTRLGGRMWSDRTTFPGQICERGGEFIDTGHLTMLDLAEEFGIALTDFDTDTGLEDLTAYFNGAALSLDDILEGFGPIAEAIDIAAAEAETDAGFERLDALSLKAWFDEIGASGPVRELLEVAYVIEYGLDVEETNCLNLIYLISSDTENFQIFGDSDERFHAREGNDQFPTRLAAALDGDQVRLGARLVALDRNSDGRTRCFFERPGMSTLIVKADHVVLALPFSILRSVENFLAFSDAKLAAINELGMGQNTKMMVGFSGRPWRDLGAVGESYSDLGYQNTWDTSRLQSGGGGILTNYTGGTEAVAIGSGDAVDQLATFLDQIDQVYPGAKADATGTVLREHWPSNPLTLGSYSAFTVGQFSAISGLEIERFENVHFCGEHTSVDYQGYMEGGALTGAMAADEVLADLGRSSASAMPGGPAGRIMARARVARLRGSIRKGGRVRK